MRPNKLRFALIGVLAVAAVLSVIGKKENSPFVGWLSFAAFIVAVFLWVTWRRSVIVQRRARVFDREAKTDETRARTDE
jgi:uncharacterized membrane protein